MIETRNLKKSFGAVHAVRDFSFSAPDGKITGLLGSNGAGKTTTLRMICGVLEPDHGSVRIDSATGGALLDHIGLYPRLTARENLEYFGELRGIPPAQLHDEWSKCSPNSAWKPSRIAAPPVSHKASA